MKVLWVCNLPNKFASEYKNQQTSVYGGWLTGLSNSLSKSKDIELIYCYPSVGSKKLDTFKVNNVKYYSFYAPKKLGIFNIDADVDNKLERKQINNILEIEKPDIVHIFGTEYIHSFMFADEMIDKNKLVCSIQGLTSVYSRHYLSFIPSKKYHSFNFSSLFRKTLWGQKKELEKRGKFEIKTIKLCKNIIGRTNWDMACTYYINSSRKYFHCNETLRDSFYEHKWDYNSCKPFTIFISQGSSPIKGLNVLIEAISLLKRDYPNIELRIAGNNFIKKDNLINILKISTYGDYIRKLIKKYSLEKNVVFLGSLDEKSMIKEYLRCNVFVSPSTIENSSNSVGEAMILGVPIVSSNVGGLASLMTDEIEGLFYQGDAPYMAAFKIDSVFKDKNKAMALGKNARIRALNTHNKKKNNDDLLKIYKNIFEEVNNA